MNRCFLFFGVRTENVETPEQRVAAVEYDEFQQQQDQRRDEQVLVLLVELLEAEGLKEGDQIADILNINNT